jgi:CBS domain-containing protein
MVGRGIGGDHKPLLLMNPNQAGAEQPYPESLVDWGACQLFYVALILKSCFWIGHDRLPAPKEAATKIKEDAMSMQAKDIMTHQVIMASPDSTLKEIASLFAKHSISAVPVCDSSGKIIGIVSERDLLRPFEKTIAQRRDWWISVLAEGTDLAPQFAAFIGRDQHRATLLMTAPVETVTEDTELAELAEIMSRKDIKRLPVVREDRVVGIVSRADLVRAIARSNLD